MIPEDMSAMLPESSKEFPYYEYPAYTFDKKYENDEFQKKVITLDSGYHLVLAACRKGGSCPLMRCAAG